MVKSHIKVRSSLSHNVKGQKYSVKRQDLRDLQKALWSVEDLTGAGRAFHRTGAQVANAQSPVVFLVQGSVSTVHIVQAKSMLLYFVK